MVYSLAISQDNYFINKQKGNCPCLASTYHFADIACSIIALSRVIQNNDIP